MSVIRKLEEIAERSDFVMGLYKQVNYEQDCDGNYQPENEQYKEAGEFTKVELFELLRLSKLGEAAEQCLDDCLFDGYDEDTATCSICFMQGCCRLRSEELK